MSELYTEAQKILSSFLSQNELNSARALNDTSRMPMAYFVTRKDVRDLFLCNDLDIELNPKYRYMLVGGVMMVTL